jgi:hypothetical protein
MRRSGKTAGGGQLDLHDLMIEPPAGAPGCPGCSKPMVRPWRINVGQGPVVLCRSCAEAELEQAESGAMALIRRVMSELGFEEHDEGWRQIRPS